MGHENLNISDVMKRINILKLEYDKLRIDWVKTGKNIPSDTEDKLVYRKRFIESIFKELDIDYNQWTF